MRTPRDTIVPIGLGLLVACLLATTFLIGRAVTPVAPVAAIVAPDSATAVRAARAACAARTAADKSDCYRRALADRIASAGVGGALAALQGLAALDPDVARDGHVYAHGIGIDAYVASRDVATTFPHCSTLFASGCYHGVIQAYLEDRTHVGAREVNEPCRAYDRPGGDRWLLFQCLHGLGHGLAMFHAHDLPRALEACDLLRDGWARESCYGGAFMESIMHATAPHHPATQLAAQRGPVAGGAHVHAAVDSAHADGGTADTVRAPFRALDPDDPLYPCSIVARRHLAACYLIQTAAMLQLNGGDIADAARSCDRAPRAMRPLCYQSLGRDITSFARQDAAESIRLCALGSARFRPWCHAGAAKSLVDWAAAVDPGLVLCRAIEVPASRLKCYEAVGEQVASLEGERGARAATCERAEPGDDVEACRYGARLTRRAPRGLPLAPP